MNTSKELNWLLGLASIIVILAGLKMAEAIVIPILLALFIGIISLPFLRLMTERGVPSGAAVMALLAVIFLFGGSVVWVVSHSVDSFMTNLPTYETRLQSLLVSITPLLEQFNLPITSAELQERINPQQIMGMTSEVLSAVSSLLTNVFLVMFIVIFLLLEEAHFPKKIEAANLDTRNANTFAEKTHQYLLIKTLVSLGTGFLVTVMLMFMGVDFPVLWGLIAMLMNFIPNVGSLIAAIPAVILAMIQLGFADAAWVAIGYVTINVVMGNIVEPKYMGKGLGLSPLVVFLSLIIWGWLFGPVGMFLSIPLTMIVKIALEQYEDTRWIAVILSDKA